MTNVQNVQGLSVVIDISHYNTVTSFSDAKTDGVVGVIPKATQSTNWSDSTYAGRKQQAQAAALWWGGLSLRNQRRWCSPGQYFLSKVNPVPNDLLALRFRREPTKPDDYRPGGTVCNGDL